MPSSLSVVFVTMCFPTPSEAFAGVEVRSLLHEGARVRVHALRTEHPLHEALAEDWGLDAVEIMSGSLAAHMRGLRRALWHPLVTAEAAAWLVARGWRSPGTLVRGLLLLPRCIEVLDDIARRRPDVVHQFWGHYPATVGHLVQRWLPGIHVSTSLGAYDLLLRYGPGLDVARRADSVWTQSECNVADLAASGIDPSRIRVQVRGVEVNRAERALRKSRDAPVVCVARLEENKGVDDVLRAFAAVHDEFPTIRLEVLGEGPQLGALTHLAAELGIADAVTFHGAVPHSRVFEALARAGTFILLSRNPSERLPNAAKEAMLSRCVCILTRTPGIDELAAAWPAPRIVAQGDWRAAARHLHESLVDADGLEAERDQARAFALVHLDARSRAREKLATWAPKEAEACAE